MHLRQDVLSSSQHKQTAKSQGEHTLDVSTMPALSVSVQLPARLEARAWCRGPKGVGLSAWMLDLNRVCGPQGTRS